ncbi:adenosylcobinamide-GDP ribazoletransferase [Pseudomonas sp. 5P_3.1_Bac2]|uniref:adenosylcobinamide-GDP ribazoletransferase n=1 Tax=Pseudomonas sp. 5P_3.1_Bac2 TaxID=2971617 RepID=UPI0021C793C3|nr:adenosylcobinamide-GDP ribazoletransferase [Pseudomonas sp. 5P_3.1_Bac2]MCU1716253.1 adenosylcobinamide-GDP ribazoletransferase [Pseudomonas sp. 5P_3.1_Bac2]
MTAWWIALQFLTRLPVTLGAMPSAQQIGRSLLFYPAVGLLIGALLCLGQWLLGDTALVLQAALLLTLWVGISGGLHLDGLADSADAWVGGFADKARTLEIMKDPRSGPIAVVVLVLLLLLKFSALWVLLQQGHGLYLLLVPWLARCLMPLLFLTTPYVRAGGLGQALAEHMPRRQLPWLLAVNAGLMLLFGVPGLLAILVGAAVFMLLRRAMLKRLEGCTGDTAGALLEVVECSVLLVLACY